MKFGSWTVKEAVGKRHSQQLWRVKCRCGATKLMTGSDVLRATRRPGGGGCSQCRQRAARERESPLSFDYASDTGLLVQALICGRPVTR